MAGISVVALGGNATFPPDITGTAQEQFAIVAKSVVGIVELIRAGHQVVITHGNGPVVGNILIRMARSADLIAPMPMDICVADSQGGIGYIIQQCLANALAAAGMQTAVAAIVTQVEVAADDPAFAAPSKPVGPHYAAAEAQRIAADTGWEFRELDAHATEGYRRLVPSPAPLRVVEAATIQQLVASGVVPITAGGGGVPVVRTGDGFRGVPAVVDKDLTSAVLALQLGAQNLVVLTGVEAVAIDFGTPQQRELSELTVAEARRHLAAGHFPEGSMGPKIRACVNYIEGGGQRALITSLEHATQALAGTTGTRIVA